MTKERPTKPPRIRVPSTRPTLHVCYGAPRVRRPSRADLEPGGYNCSELRARQRGWKRLA
jgi:hypothetical protein